MDYEKAYKDALAKAREIHRNEDEKRFDMEWLFPELEENKDEKIRGAIIDHLKDNNLIEWAAWLEKQGDVKFPEVPIEHGKYYYCIKDYYSGGNLRAKRGDVVQALRGMSMMILDSMEAGKYFLPVNKIKKQGEFTQSEVTKISDKVWSEEDEEELGIAIQYLQLEGQYDSINWLKSLKNRLKGE